MRCAWLAFAARHRVSALNANGTDKRNFSLQFQTAWWRRWWCDLEAQCGDPPSSTDMYGGMDLKAKRLHHKKKRADSGWWFYESIVNRDNCNWWFLASGRTFSEGNVCTLVMSHKLKIDHWSCQPFFFPCWLKVDNLLALKTREVPEIDLVGVKQKGLLYSDSKTSLPACLPPPPHYP